MPWATCCANISRRQTMAATRTNWTTRPWCCDGAKNRALRRQAMHNRKYKVFLIGATLLLALSTAHARKHHHESAPAQAHAQGGHFDYYLMSLSWSPSFCTTHPQER